MRLVTRDEMRELDRATIEDYGTPSLVLMERAGRGVMQAIHARHPVVAGLRCLVLAGRGNNGGDGWVAARALRAAAPCAHRHVLRSRLNQNPKRKCVGIMGMNGRT